MTQAHTCSYSRKSGTGAEGSRAGDSGVPTAAHRSCLARGRGPWGWWPLSGWQSRPLEPSLPRASPAGREEHPASPTHRQPLNSCTFLPPSEEENAIAGTRASLNCIQLFFFFFPFHFFHSNLVVFSRAKSCRQ